MLFRSKMQGWYVPFMREGEHIAAGRKVIEVEENAYTKKIADKDGYENTVQISDPNGKGSEPAARDAAEKYVAEHPELHIKTELKHVDSRDMTTLVPAEDLNAVPVYRLKFQDRVFELHTSESAARKARERMEADGLYDTYNDILRNLPDNRMSALMPSQYKTLMDSLQKRDGFQKMPPEQDRKSTRLNSSHIPLSRMPSSA